MNIQALLTWKYLLLLVVIAFFAFLLIRKHFSPGLLYYNEARKLQHWYDNTLEFQPDRIIELYSKAIEAEPNNFRYVFARGNFYFDQGFFAKSAIDFHKTNELNQFRHPYQNYQLALAYSKLGKFEQAIASYKKAIELNSENAQFWGKLALAYLQAGKFDLANDTMAESVSRFPKFYRWNYERAVILLCTGNIEEAKKVFGKTIVFSKALNGGGVEDVFFDGAKEIKRTKGCKPSFIKQMFHYGDWISLSDITDEYSKH